MELLALGHSHTATYHVSRLPSFESLSSYGILTPGKIHPNSEKAMSEDNSFTFGWGLELTLQLRVYPEGQGVAPVTGAETTCRITGDSARACCRFDVESPDTLMLALCFSNYEVKLCLFLFFGDGFLLCVV